MLSRLWDLKRAWNTPGLADEHGCLYPPSATHLQTWQSFCILDA